MVKGTVLCPTQLGPKYLLMKIGSVFLLFARLKELHTLSHKGSKIFPGICLVY